jgi:hypothetical protein
MTLASRLRFAWHLEATAMDRHRQLHLWISEHDYRLLQDVATAHCETLSAVVRRLIKMQSATVVDAPNVADEQLRLVADTREAS